MAGDWIKMRGNLWDDPRVSRMCDLTGQSEASVIGGLYWLWAAADQHTEDGVMQGLSLSAINRKVGIKKFGEALTEVGWIADHPEGTRIVRFEEHNGASAKRRCQTAKRVANHESKQTANANLTQPALADDEDSVSGALARERDREDNYYSDPNGSGAEAPDARIPENQPEPQKPEKSADQLTKDELWTAGKSILESAGMPAKQCGSFVGKLVKDYGNDIVIEAVRLAVVERPADPVSFLKAVCQREAGQRKEPEWIDRRRREDEKRQADVAAIWGNSTNTIDGNVIDITPRAAIGGAL